MLADVPRPSANESSGRKLHEGEEEVINLSDRFGKQIEAHRLTVIRYAVRFTWILPTARYRSGLSACG
jgi:hypothetical protein